MLKQFRLHELGIRRFKIFYVASTQSLIFKNRRVKYTIFKDPHNFDFLRLCMLSPNFHHFLSQGPLLIWLVDCNLQILWVE